MDRNITLYLDARESWKHTGIRLNLNDPIRIEASGQWSNGGETVGADGFGSGNYMYPGTIVGTAALASLVGMVGDQAFKVGALYDRTSPATGELLLSMNDVAGTFADNRGQLEVKIRYRSK